MTSPAAPTYAAGNEGLYILDVRDPSNPVELRRRKAQGWTFRVDVEAGRAYVLDPNLLRIFDVTSLPAAPLLGSLAVPDAQDIKVSDGIAVLPSGPNGVAIVDVSDPSAPALITSALSPFSPLGVDIAGSVAYVTYLDNFKPGLFLLDLSDPANPVELPRPPIPVESRHIEIIGERAHYGAVVLDVSTPSVPIVLGGFPAGDGQIEGVTAVDEFNVYAGFYGLEVIELGPEFDPSLEGVLDIRPGVEHNRVRLHSRMLVKVALLGSDDVDVRDIVPGSLRFGPRRHGPSDAAATGSATRTETDVSTWARGFESPKQGSSRAQTRRASSPS